MLVPWKKSYDQTRQCIKKQRYSFANESPSTQSFGFPSSHVWMWELDCKESWAPKNWCFWTAVLEKTPESPLGGKEIKPVNPKGNQFWIFIGRTDAEAETPILWPSDAKDQLTGKDLDPRKYWKQEEKGTTEDEMIRWHRWTWVWIGSQELVMGRETWLAAVLGVAKCQTRLSDETELNWCCQCFLLPILLYTICFRWLSFFTFLFSLLFAPWFPYVN